jgi:hypothetical protein
VVAACRAGALRLAQLPDNDGAAGTISVLIQVRNTAAHTCTLRGYPQFTLTAHSASTGADVPLAVTPTHGQLAGPFAAPVTTVAVAPGGAAGFLLAYRNRTASGDGACAVSTKLHLRLPGQAGTVVGPAQVLVCVPTVTVSAFVPGSKLTFS